MRSRTVWLQVHLWLGLIAGFVFALIGATGAMLTLGEPLMRWQHGTLLYPPLAQAHLADWSQADRWLAAAQARYPEIELEGVYGPHATPVPSTAIIAVGHEHSDDGSFTGHVVIPIDAATGQPTGSLVFEQTLYGVLMGLHTHLLLEPLGHMLVPWLSLLLPLSVVSGLVLWWPKAGGWWRALTVRWRLGGRREWLSWHNAISVWTLPAMLVVWLSGIYLLRNDWFDPAIKQVSVIREPDPATFPKQPRCEGATTLGSAVSVAQRAYPGLSVRAATMPEDDPLAPVFVALMPAGADGRAMSTEVWVDRHCPEVLFARTGHDLSAGEWLKSRMRPIHADLLLGGFGLVAVAAAGLSLPIAYVSGVVLWWRWRRKAGARRAALELPTRSSRAEDARPDARPASRVQ